MEHDICMVYPKKMIKITSHCDYKIAPTTHNFSKLDMSTLSLTVTYMLSRPTSLFYHKIDLEKMHYSHLCPLSSIIEGD